MYVIDGTEDNKPSRIPHIIPHVLWGFIIFSEYKSLSGTHVKSYSKMICMCIFCRSLFVLLYFFWLLDLRILITPLVPSNSSYSESFMDFEETCSLFCIILCFLHFRCNTTILNCRWARVVKMYYVWLLLTVCYFHQSHSCYPTIHFLVSMIWNFISHRGSALAWFIRYIHYPPSGKLTLDFVYPVYAFFCFIPLKTLLN